MLFSWWKRRRRKRILAQPFPPAWDETLATVPHLAVLNEDERRRLRQRVQVFLAEKSFIGRDGLEVTDPMRVTVAGLASLLALGLPDSVFDAVDEILIHPGVFTGRKQVAIGA